MSNGNDIIPGKYKDKVRVIKTNELVITGLKPTFPLSEYDPKHKDYLINFVENTVKAKHELPPFGGKKLTINGRVRATIFPEIILLNVKYVVSSYANMVLAYWNNTGRKAQFYISDFLFLYPRMYYIADNPYLDVEGDIIRPVNKGVLLTYIDRYNIWISRNL